MFEYLNNKDIKINNMAEIKLYYKICPKEKKMNGLNDIAYLSNRDPVTEISYVPTYSGCKIIVTTESGKKLNARYTPCRFQQEYRQLQDIY